MLISKFRDFTGLFYIMSVGYDFLLVDSYMICFSIMGPFGSHKEKDPRKFNVGYLENNQERI